MGIEPAVEISQTDKGIIRTLERKDNNKMWIKAKGCGQANAFIRRTTEREDGRTTTTKWMGG